MRGHFTGYAHEMSPIPRGNHIVPSTMPPPPRPLHRRRLEYERRRSPGSQVYITPLQVCGSRD